MPDTAAVTIEVDAAAAPALALAAGAGTLVSGDADPLVLDPWRGVRILKLAAYLAAAEGGR